MAEIDVTTQLRKFNFKIRSRDWYIARDLLNGENREQIARKYFELVGDQEPWVFKENIPGSYRRAKPVDEQRSLSFGRLARPSAR